MVQPVRIHNNTPGRFTYGGAGRVYDTVMDRYYVTELACRERLNEKLTKAVRFASEGGASANAQRRINALKEEERVV